MRNIMLDKTDHAKLARDAAARLADKYIPAAGREVERTDNNPPDPVSNETAVKAYAAALMVSTPAIASAEQALPLLSSFIADNPVFQNAEDLQKGGVWIESARKTLAALEDERKPKVEPLNAALAIINEPYRRVRQEIEGTKQAKGLLEILVDRWNAGEKAERKRREAIAEATRLEAEKAARVAQALIDQTNDAIAAADVGACEDVGSAVIDARAAIRNANILDRTANRAEKETHVRVASQLGGRALAPRSEWVLTIDDPGQLIAAMGLSERTADSLRTDARAFFKATGEWPDGLTATKDRSI
jgi:hypothetical protein